MRTGKLSIYPGDMAVLKDGRHGRIRTVVRGARGRVSALLVEIDEKKVRVIPQQLGHMIPVLRSEWRERLHRGHRLAWR
jgi:hypothetical protein